MNIIFNRTLISQNIAPVIKLQKDNIERLKQL